MQKVLCLFFIMILFISNFNVVFAANVRDSNNTRTSNSADNEDTEDKQESDDEANDTSTSDDDDKNDENTENNKQNTSNTTTSTSVTSVSTISTSVEANLEFNNKLNFVLIAIGVLIILFAIALLIRLSKK